MSFNEDQSFPRIYLIYILCLVSLTTYTHSTVTVTNTTINDPGIKETVVQQGKTVFYSNYTHIKAGLVPDSEEGSNSTTNAAETFKEGGPPKFDEHAVQRGFIVFGGLVGIVIVYFSVKIIWIRRKRRLRNGAEGVGVYGLLQTSEMNLLQSLDPDQSDSDDGETTHYQLPTVLSRELDPRPIQR